MTQHPPLADQLSALARSFRRIPLRIHNVFQTTCFLSGVDGASTATAARSEALKWLQRRCPRLPSVAWSGESVEFDEVGLKASIIAISSAYWAARLEHPDQNVAGRVWSTEIGIGFDQNQNRAQFGVRLCFASSELDPFFDPSTPGIVRQLAASPGLEDYGWPLRKEPHFVSSYEDVRALVTLLRSDARTRLVFVVSGTDGQDGMDAAIDPSTLAEKCLGIAHVFYLPREFTFDLSDLVGKEYSVFNGAVRSYFPRFRPLQDPPFQHPLALANRIQNWPGGSAAFLQFLVQSAYFASVSRADLEHRLPAFAVVRTYQIEQRRKSAIEEQQSDREIWTLFEQENAELKTQLSQWEELATTQDSEIGDLKLETKTLRAQIHWMQAEIDRLRSEFRNQGREIEDEPNLPDDLAELEAWASRWLAGRLVLHPRAIRTAKDSHFDDVPKIFAALLILGNAYRNTRLQGGAAQKRRLDDQLAQNGFEISQTFAGSRLGEFGDTYIVKWLDQKHELDLHLKNRGNTRDPRRCLRVYFFWDDDSRQVVVGSLPGHLDNRLT